MQTGNCLKVLSTGNEGVHGVAFHPNKPILAAGLNNGSILLWNLQTDECFATLKEHRDSIRSLTFTTEGKTLITGSLDGTIKFWDISSENSHKTLIAPRCYQGMNLTGIQGLNRTEIVTLKQLGAVCEESDFSLESWQGVSNPQLNSLLQQCDRPFNTLGKNHH
ncbi:MAG: hypothetical protein VKK42_14335 [Lyngbya sp.]|nr:hypothetical protein [Lyngbya sp.]